MIRDLGSKLFGWLWLKILGFWQFLTGPSWTETRAFGELQILTRASYLMLILVPILAGLWPAVRHSVNHYNAVAIESNKSLEHASERIEFAVSSLQDSNIIEQAVEKILKNLNEGLESIIANHSPRTIESPNLPWPWASSFFASLVVTLAHLIYQVRAPELIKRSTWREHVRNEIRQFVSAPSKNNLDRARYFLDKEKEQFPGGIDLDAYFDISEGTLETLEQKVTLIDRGSGAEYRIMAKQNPNSARASWCLYLLGIAIIGLIMLDQAVRVYAAAGG